MRMSVRSPICHAASPRPPAFLGPRRRTPTGQRLPCSPQEVTPAPDEPSYGGPRLGMVPGCGEERIPSGGPLGVAGEE